MLSEKVFGQYDKLRGQIVVMPHPDAVADLLAAKGLGGGLFLLRALYRNRARRWPRAQGAERGRRRSTARRRFSILGATKAYIAAHPQGGGSGRQGDGRGRAASSTTIRATPPQIFLAHEPSKTLDAATLAAVIGDIKDEFGSTVHGVAGVRRFHGPARRAQSAAAELEGNRRAGAVELAEHASGRGPDFFYAAAALDLTAASDYEEDAMADRMLNVVCICGSLRKASYNRMVMNALPGACAAEHEISEAPPFAEFSALQCRHCRKRPAYRRRCRSSPTRSAPPTA